jgi:hypothetical protein
LLHEKLSLDYVESVTKPLINGLKTRDKKLTVTLRFEKKSAAKICLEAV